MEWIMKYDGPAVELATKFGPMQVKFLTGDEVFIEAGQLGSSGQDAVLTFRGKHYRAGGNVHGLSAGKRACTFRDDRGSCGRKYLHHHNAPWFSAAGTPYVSSALKIAMIDTLREFVATEEGATMLALAEANYISRQLQSAEKQAADMRATLAKVDRIIQSSRRELADLLIARGQEFGDMPDVRAIITRAALPAGCHTPLPMAAAAGRS